MNAEYMMHGFLHVPNASASRAAHVNLKRSQGVCLILEFLHISLRSSTLEFTSEHIIKGMWYLRKVVSSCEKINSVSKCLCSKHIKGAAHLWGLFYHHFFLSEIFILSFQVFYIMLYGYWSIRENFFGKFWWHPAKLWPAEWSTIFSLSARFLMFGWPETVNPYLFLKRAWMVIVPSKILKIRL